MALQSMAHSFLELCKPLCYDKAVIHKEDEPPRSEGVQYSTGEEQRNSSRENEEARPKWKGHSIVDVSGGKSKVRCCKEQYFIGTWNVRSMYQGKFDVVKQEMARMNINILGVSELKWMEMGKFNSDDHYIYYCGQESLRKNGVALIVNKSLKCSTWVQSQNDRMILVRFQGKAFSITVIQVYVPRTDAEEAEIDQFYEDVQHPLELATVK